MNVTSEYIREKLRVFDTGGFFGRKVGKTALLRDEGYSVHSLNDLEYMVPIARSETAIILGIEVEDLPHIYSKRFDCDNYTLIGCSILKAIHDRQCREKSKDDLEYAIWPVSRSDINHTQGLCLTKEGFFIVEWITGEIFSAKNNKPAILMVG